MVTSLEIVVRPTEIDVNGHVNNAKYVEYLEWGREDWYERNGLPSERLLGLGAVTVTVNLNLNFRRECRQGEALIVATRPERLGRASWWRGAAIRRFQVGGRTVVAPWPREETEMVRPNRLPSDSSR